MENDVRVAAEKWLKNRFPDYRKDQSVMHVDVEVFKAGAAWQLIRVLETLRSMNQGIKRPSDLANWLEEKLK